jgi:3-methyladenine DNA glycosylase AlkC
MTQKLLLKDLLFNQTKVRQVSEELNRVHPPFRQDDFARAVLSRFPELELKARIAWMAECLRAHLPDDYRQAVRIIVQSLPVPNDPTLTDGDFGDFIYAPYSEFVARFGCNERDFDISLGALREITMRFSAEDAIRYFINAFSKRTLDTLVIWSEDTHYHVRRLCSEGTRPKLPWSQKLTIPITAPIPLLNNLFADRTRFVTRSVANHINDISKTDPALAIQLLTSWKSTGRQRPEEMRFLLTHGLRTLIKQGDANALILIGALPNPAVRVSQLRVPAEMAMNTALEFSFAVQAKQDVEIVVDYAITFQTKSGKPGRKVFKLKQCSLAKGQTIMLSKRHMLREDMTTRKLFRGRHELEIQINGHRFGKRSFQIV